MSSILDLVRDLSETLRATAEEVDQSFAPPRAQMQAVAATGYFTYVTDGPSSERRRLLDYLSSGCGVTAFLASQHEAVCRMLARSGHSLLQSAQRGETWMGVCFAHLRRTPSPVSVTRRDGHLQFQGLGPWFSGLGLMKNVVVAGAAENGEFLMAHCLLDSPGITVGEAPRLAVMNATSTVPLTFDGLTVPNSEIVFVTNAEDMNEKDMHSTVMQCGRSLGAARAAARFLPPSGEEQLLARVEDLHARMDAWDQSPCWPTATALRVDALKLASLAVQSAFVCAGGGANLLSHPVQRLAREASFYATTQLTKELRDTYLRSL